MSTKWKPRSSQLGGYLNCSYRAAFDRALAEGLMELEPKEAEVVAAARVSSPAASFGTWAHFVLQDGLGCEFEGGREAHKPAPEVVVSATSIYANDFEATAAAVRQCATIAAKHMPIPKDGRPWLAEASCTTSFLSGHLDFLSQDRLHVVDLKTTSRMPTNGKAKAEHIAQVCGAYPLLVFERFGIMPTTATILYVDSGAGWACPVTIDLTTKERVQYIQQTKDYAQFLRSKGLFKMTMPVLGPHCSDGWCPYRSICADRLKASGESSEHGVPPTATMRSKGL